MEQFHPDCKYCQIIDNPEASLVHEDEHVVCAVGSHRQGYKGTYLIITKYGHYSQEELPQGEWDYMVEAAHALGRTRVWGTEEKYEVIEGQDVHASIEVGFR